MVLDLHFWSFCSVTLSVDQVMSAKMNSESDPCKKADFSLKNSERISLINKDLAPVTHIRKSSNKPVIDRQLFESMDQEDVVKLAVKLVSQLDDVKVLLRDCRTVLEDIDTLPHLDPSPQISSQISDLQCNGRAPAHDRPNGTHYILAMQGTSSIHS